MPQAGGTTSASVSDPKRESIAFRARNVPSGLASGSRWTTNGIEHGDASAGEGPRGSRIDAERNGVGGNDCAV